MKRILDDQVDAELKAALKKVAEVLAETNASLAARGLSDYMTVAASLYYNSPTLVSDVESLSVVLLPYAEILDAAFVPSEQTAEVGVYSPATGALQFVTVTSTDLDRGDCNRERKGKRCKAKGPHGETLFCKAIYLSGNKPTYCCLPADPD